MNIDKAAAVLEVHPEHVRRLVRSGNIIATKDGRSWEISELDLEAYRERRRSGNDEGGVYIIEALGIGLFKIGISSCPKNRLLTLATCSPAPLKMRLEAPAPCGMEYALHQKFAEKRSHGEWFKLSEDDIDAARVMVNAPDATLRAAIAFAAAWAGDDARLIRHLMQMVSSDQCRSIMTVRAMKNATTPGTTA